MIIVVIILCVVVLSKHMQYINNLKYTSLCILTTIFLFFGIFFGAFSIIFPNKAHSQTTEIACTSDVGLYVENFPVQTTATVTGIANIGVSTIGSMSSQINKIILLSNGQPIGRAVQKDSYNWVMRWATGLTPMNSTVKLTAQAYFSTTTTGVTTQRFCTTQPVYVTVTNTHASALNFSVNPVAWTGPMSTSMAINTSASVVEPAFDPTPFAIYEWRTTIGYINSSQSSAQFSAGNTVGTGAVTIVIRYGGSTKEVTIPITVKNVNAPLPTTQSTTTSPTTTTKPTTTATITASPTIQNPTAQDCVISAIGKDRFTQINTGQIRPTPVEIEKFKLCFATSNYVVPSNFAPIAPTTVKELKQVNTISVTKLQNETKTIDNIDKKVLKISGKASPSSVVFIYIYSDPLVLTTTTDGNGNWEYTLEDPIEPGNHEVYSVVNRGDGVYERSNPLSFVMGTAEAAQANPDGLSLRLVGNATPAQSQKSLVFYIVGSITVLVFAIVLFAISLRMRRTGTVSLSGVPMNQANDIGLQISTPADDDTPDTDTNQDAENNKGQNN